MCVCVCEGVSGGSDVVVVVSIADGDVGMVVVWTVKVVVGRERLVTVAVEWVFGGRIFGFGSLRKYGRRW